MKMKTKQLLLTFALLLTAGVAQAQSTYTWNAGDWSAYNGNGTVTNDGGTLTCTFGEWCGSVYSSTSFKLPKRQTFIVIKGTNLYCGPTDPNVCNLNGDLGGKLSGFTANGDNTMIYKDITDILPSETDFFGNVTINSIALYLKKGEGSTTITSIDFVAADLLDGASSVTIDKADDEALTSADDEFKKTLTFTPNQTSNDMGIVFNTNQKLNNSDMFLVIESDNASLNTSSRIKLRNLTVNGTKYENNNGGCYVAAREVSTGHYLYIHSFYKGGSGVLPSSTLLGEWTTNPTMNVTTGTLYINSSDLKDTPIKIYRLGFYNLSEIMNMYNLSSQQWWYVKSQEGTLDVEIHGSAPVNWLKINNAGDKNTNTAAYGAQIVRSMGYLPSNFTGIELRKLSFVDEEQPLKYDIFADLPATITTIFLSPDEYTFFPTMNTNVKVAGYGYSQYKDGIRPQDVTKTTDGSGTAWSSYTRYFKAGYNSCCLPFNKPQYASLPSGIQVYTISGFNDGELTFAKQTANSEDSGKGIPVIVHADAEGYYMIIGRDPISTNGEAFDTYYNAVEAPTSSSVYFVGSFVNKVPDDTWAAGENCVNYGITADATSLAKMKSTTKTTFYRAFISDKRTGASVKALSLSFDEGDGTTKIVAPEEIDGLEMTSGNVYNLQGVRMTSDKLPRGIYVRNGKKFVVK